MRLARFMGNILESGGFGGGALTLFFGAKKSPQKNKSSHGSSRQKQTKSLPGIVSGHKARMGTELNPNHLFLRFGHEKQYSVRCAAFFIFDKPKSSIQKQRQYSKRGYLPALKFAFGHEMGTFWARSRFLAGKFLFQRGEKRETRVGANVCESINTRFSEVL